MNTFYFKNQGVLFVRVFFVFSSAGFGVGEMPYKMSCAAWPPLFFSGQDRGELVLILLETCGKILQ